ncbi:putative TIM barrel metal-dependent hydrolase [Aspergillus steynii IBT 23096]|uniref:Putative TIM barrel metal-dependent hydrolase n=1 Tax=Aspergillus steynii IBT 23096 TaxID=1392250 RepID=A0A2I2FVI5_9EURO|nr:putative TIM barrel metal-dependent hydrolase [Aspergillus steynii IBT 23096]PLB44642.1 putative TIM barrel metal-dependent hydrolase [Aspergillus steynii IBT 23096]
MVQPSLSGVLTSVKPRTTSLLDSPLRLSFGTSIQKREQTSYCKETRKPLHPLPLKQRIPPRTWDTHMHVVEPQHYPVSASAVYQPSAHTLDEAVSFESSLGIENIVLVQPSIYGTDNSCLLDALKQIGPSRGRGVVVINPANIEAKTLCEWHALGVRGVRVNLKSVGKVLNEHELAETLLQHAARVRPLGWIIQVYIALDMVPMLERIAPQLGVKVCIDHFGAPDLLSLSLADGNPFDPYSLPGFSSLISLLRAGDTYIKISAPYRLSKDKEMRDLEMMIREFLLEAPKRVIYATDWPHTRHSGVDIEPFTELCLRLCGDEPGLAERIFRQNAEELMDGRHR